MGFPNVYSKQKYLQPVNFIIQTIKYVGLGLFYN